MMVTLLVWAVFLYVLYKVMVVFDNHSFIVAGFAALLFLIGALLMLARNILEFFDDKKPYDYYKE